MTQPSILYEVENRVATLTLNRPRLKNALDQAALDLLVERIGAARTDDAVWLLVIRASGADFCVGQDVKELSDKGNRGDYFEPVFMALKTTFKPVICAVRGLCLAGGAGIAMGSDIRILSETARLSWPHARIGLCSIGGPSTLARAIPVNLALEYMFTGEYMSAQRALQLGIANRVVPDDALEQATADIMQKVLRNAPLSIRSLKEATLKTLDLPYGEAVKYAHTVLDKLMESRDAREGMRAFLEKRPPVWEAR
ncbi:MAG TPA: enoyl-CoA hydratase/isomerase family protein [Burkholderiales bacterium]|nr:enoyl-CoA hydratase/isomerase family protein [Burkholderiales bacterium]